MQAAQALTPCHLRSALPAAAADLLLLYASTHHWLTCGERHAPPVPTRRARCLPAHLPQPQHAPAGPTVIPAIATHRYNLRSLWLAERGYRTIVSSPVPLNLEDLTLDRAAGTHSADAAAALLARADAQRAEENGLVEEEEEEEEPQPEPEPSGGGGGSKPASRAGSMQDVSAAATAGSEAEGGALGELIWLGWLWCGHAGRQLVCCAAGTSRVLCRSALSCHLRLHQTGHQVPLPPTSSFPPAASALCKVYRPLYVWGQLSSWFKQTVNDPTASLSAERRGTASLPDLESAFAGGQARYSPKVGPAAASGEVLL